MKFWLLGLIVANCVNGFVGLTNAVADDGAANKNSAVPALATTPAGLDLFKAMGQKPSNDAENISLFQKKLMEECQKDPKCSIQLKPTVAAPKVAE